MSGFAGMSVYARWREQRKQRLHMLKQEEIEITQGCKTLQGTKWGCQDSIQSSRYLGFNCNENPSEFQVSSENDFKFPCLRVLSCRK